MGEFDAVDESWRADPQGFWARAAEDVVWTKRWDRVLDNGNPPFYRWFVGGETDLPLLTGPG